MATLSIHSHTQWDSQYPPFLGKEADAQKGNSLKVTYPVHERGSDIRIQAVFIAPHGFAITLPSLLKKLSFSLCHWQEPPPPLRSPISQRAVTKVFPCGWDLSPYSFHPQVFHLLSGSLRANIILLLRSRLSNIRWWTLNNVRSTNIHRIDEGHIWRVQSMAGRTANI